MTVGRVVFEYGLAQVLDIYMGIDFRRSDALVPEQLLDYSEVGAVLQKMGGKTVAQCVRRYLFLDTGFPCQGLGDMENHRAGQLSAVMVQKGDIHILRLDIQVVSVLQPVAELFHRFGRDRY